jgi:hypothetical protein
MMDINSNCSRVDAVKAAASQIKLQWGASQPAPADAAKSGNDSSGKVKSDLTALDSQIKTGDAKKAEQALAVTRKDVAAAVTTSHPPSPNPALRGFSTYA